MKNTSLIEQKSIEILKSALLPTEYIDCSQIKEGDKGVSWDGELLIHSSKNWTTSDVHRIPIQIKSTTRKKITNKDNIPFSVELDHLKNYYHEGGILYFYILIDDKNNTHKIYFNSSLTFDLAVLISNSKNNKSKMILNVFPEGNSAEIMVIMRDFITNRPKQMNLIEKNVNAYNFNIRNKNHEGLLIPFYYPKNEKDPLTYMTKSSHYVYGKIPGTNYEELICKANNIVVKQSIPVPIYIDKKKYFNNYFVIRKNGKEFVRIEDFLTICPPNNNLSTIKVNIHGLINRQIKATEFIVNMFENKGFNIGNDFLPYEGDPGIELDNLKQRLTIMKLHKKALKNFDVIDELNYDSMNETDFKSMDALTRAALLQQKVIFNDIKEQLLYGPITIGNLRINVWAERDNNSYKIESFNHGRPIANFSQDDITKKHPDPVPYCVLLTADDYAFSSNLNFNKIYNDITSGKWSETALSHIVIAMLEMIKGYDLCGNKNTALFSLIHRVCKYLSAKDSLDKTIMLINRMQITIRKRKLNKKEIEEITRTLEDEKNIENKCALNILLNNKEEALKLYNSMNKKTKAIFTNYPIYFLLRKDNI